MRVLVITNIYPTAAAPASGTFVEQQVEGLRRGGIDAELLFLDRLRDGPGVYRQLARQVTGVRRTFRPDLVHVMYGGVMAERVTRLAKGEPVIVTFHGSDLLGENLSGLLRKAASWYGVACSWRAAARAAGVVVVSPELRDALPRWIDRDRVRVIPCGIDLARFQPRDRAECRRRLDWSMQEFAVLFNGGSQDPVKRPELAHEAVRILRERYPHATLRELRGVPNVDVPEWMNASNVLLLTSQHEGSPTVVKEALACNLPVVSVDVGDVRERIGGVEGCHVVAPDATALAERLAAVLERGQLVRGREQVEGLSIEAIGVSLKAFYELVLAENRRVFR